jgi:hypothetical protein
MDMSHISADAVAVRDRWAIANLLEVLLELQRLLESPAAAEAEAAKGAARRAREPKVGEAPRSPTSTGQDAGDESLAGYDDALLDVARAVREAATAAADAESVLRRAHGARGEAWGAQGQARSGRRPRETAAAASSDDEREAEEDPWAPLQEDIESFVEEEETRAHTGAQAPSAQRQRPRNAQRPQTAATTDNKGLASPQQRSPRAHVPPPEERPVRDARELAQPGPARDAALQTVLRAHVQQQARHGRRPQGTPPQGPQRPAHDGDGAADDHDQSLADVFPHLSLSPHSQRRLWNKEYKVGVRKT